MFEMTSSFFQYKAQTIFLVFEILSEVSLSIVGITCVNLVFSFEVVLGGSQYAIYFIVLYEM